MRNALVVGRGPRRTVIEGRLRAVQVSENGYVPTSLIGKMIALRISSPRGVRLIHVGRRISPPARIPTQFDARICRRLSRSTLRRCLGRSVSGRRTGLVAKHLRDFWVTTRIPIGPGRETCKHVLTTSAFFRDLRESKLPRAGARSAASWPGYPGCKPVTGSASAVDLKAVPQAKAVTGWAAAVPQRR